MNIHYDCLEGQRLALVFGVVFLASCVLIVNFVCMTHNPYWRVLAPPGVGDDTTGREKVAIQSISGNVATGTITLLAQSTGGDPVVLDSAVIKDYKGMKLEVVDATSIDDYDAHTADKVPTVDAKLTTLVIKVKNETLAAGESYTVTLVTQNGGSFVSQSFKAEAIANEYLWKFHFPSQAND